MVMYFLVDFENVNNNGMKGVEFLQPNDHLLVFYSDASPYMETQILEDIRKSNCDFQVFKLVSHRKNGLDFYISTKLGECIAHGEKTAIAIVSKDNDFASAREFWISVNKPTRSVMIRESIEKAIISSGENSERVKILKERSKQLDIGQFYSAYTERRMLQKKLKEIFADTEFSALTTELEEMLTTRSTPKIVYLDTLHRFGRDSGLAIYRKLKEQEVI